MSRRRRVLALSVAVLVALVVTTAVALPWLVRRAVVWQLRSATGRSVTLDGVELALRSGRVGLRGLRVVEGDGAPLLTVDGVDVRFSPRDLLRGHLRIVDGTVRGTRLRVVRTGPHTFNVSDLVGRRGRGGESSLATTIERFALLDGAVTFEDRTLSPPRTWRVEQIELRARDASTVAGAPAGSATLTAVAAGAPVSLSLGELRLAPAHFRGALDIRGLDASLAALYLPPGSPLTPERGTLSLSATVDHDGSTGTRVALDAELAGVELRRPGQERAYLSAPGVRVKVEDLRAHPGGVELGRLAVDGGALTLEDTRLVPARRWQIDGVALEARNLSSARDAAPGTATARAATAGARVEVWVTNARLAPLELHATTIVRNIDLSLVRLYLPPELPVHPERGIVDATVKVEHGRAGTRLSLDAGLGGIELRRPAHFVAAPSVRVRAEDIALESGAVTVGRATVVGGRLTIEERAARPVRTWRVQDLVIEATDLSSRREAVQGVASVRANVAGASASIFVTGVRLQPLELHATTVLRNIDAALLRLYMPDSVPVVLRRGVVNATYQVDHSVASGSELTGDATFTAFAAEGRGALATLSVVAPSLRFAIASGRRQAENLSVRRVELSGAGVFTDSRGTAARFDLSELRIASEGLTWPVTAPARVEVGLRFRDRGELEGGGTARLTAPLPTVAWHADLGLKFRGVDLSPLAVYVPALAGLGGRVRADVTAALEYAGDLKAHVRGDVGGARFALAEDGRTLLSLRSIGASGLDIRWPERVAITQVRLREPYGLIVRDRRGMFPLAARFAPAPREPAASPSRPAGARPALPPIAIDEVVVDNGSATFVDEANTPPLRIEMPRVGLTVRNVTWPASAPFALSLAGTFPGGGVLKVDGTATAEPAAVDVKLALENADLSALQPYLAFRARIAGRVSGNLAVAGELSPALRVDVKGDADFRKLQIADGQRPVLSADVLSIGGIDASWPTRVVFDRLRMRRSWALIQRDEQGRFLLRTLLERPPAPAGTPPAARAPATSASAPLQFSFREAIFTEQAATIVDGATTPPARIEVAGARFTVRDFVWPPRTPARVELSSPMPAGGRVDLSGTVELDPVRVDAKATLDAVAVEPVQPYLPIEGRVAGKVTGDLTMKLTLDPTAVHLTGQARLQGFRLRDGDRPVVSVARLDTAGIDVDWPRRIGVERVLLRRPRLLIERDAEQVRLLRLITPRWNMKAEEASTVAAPGAPSEPVLIRRAPPSIDVGSLVIEAASARFVDQTTTPPYAEEIEDLNVTFAPLTTAAGRRTRVTAGGVVGGGSFTLEGDGAYGERPTLDLKWSLKNFIVPRANPYIDRYTGWVATNGSLEIAGRYALDGTRLETNHDLLMRGLEVASVDRRDEVERRIGLPFGMLVSLLRDARGEIKLSLPVSGDLGAREFDYTEAVWATVRNLSIRLLALPFSRIGSLFFSQDSKVKAVALSPVVFEPGGDRPAAGMQTHLEKVGEFLRGAPSLKVVLDPIVIESDVQSLRAGLPAGAPVPRDALRGLAARRVDAVRQALVGAGVDAARLSDSARRAALIEAVGQPRVEFDLRP